LAFWLTLPLLRDKKKGISSGIGRASHASTFLGHERLSSNAGASYHAFWR
jgi:hypothetical protein